MELARGRAWYGREGRSGVQCAVCPGPDFFCLRGPNMTMAPTSEKCRPIFELKVAPYFQS